MVIGANRSVPPLDGSFVGKGASGRLFCLWRPFCLRLHAVIRRPRLSVQNDFPSRSPALVDQIQYYDWRDGPGVDLMSAIVGCTMHWW
jgi:hypothetical protein